MSPEQLSFMIGSFYGSALTLLLFPPNRRSRNRQRPPGGRYGLPRGYRSINYPDPSPGRRPTNPCNGERIPNHPPREP